MLSFLKFLLGQNDILGCCFPRGNGEEAVLEEMLPKCISMAQKDFFKKALGIISLYVREAGLRHDPINCLLCTQRTSFIPLFQRREWNGEQGGFPREVEKEGQREGRKEGGKGGRKEGRKEGRIRKEGRKEKKEGRMS
jgi:hypothetical protein